MACMADSGWPHVPSISASPGAVPCAEAAPDRRCVQAPPPAVQRCGCRVLRSAVLRWPVRSVVLRHSASSCVARRLASSMRRPACQRFNARWRLIRLTLAAYLPNWAQTTSSSMCGAAASPAAALLPEHSSSSGRRRKAAARRRRTRAVGRRAARRRAVTRRVRQQGTQPSCGPPRCGSQLLRVSRAPALSWILGCLHEIVPLPAVASRCLVFAPHASEHPVLAWRQEVQFSSRESTAHLSGCVLPWFPPVQARSLPLASTAQPRMASA